MKVGVALPMYEPLTGRVRSLPEMGEDAELAERLGYDSLWVMDHIWVQRGQRRGGGHDPMVLLAYLAARTSRIQLGTLVLCNSFRHPGQMAREAAAVAAASGGRLILGVGAGWHQPEYDAFGFPFDHRVGRLEETLAVLGPLLAGERVSFKGRHVRLTDASILTTAPAPPVWLAGSGERMRRLAARHAAGWNSAWHGPDPSQFATLTHPIRAEMDLAGRPAESMELSPGIFAIPLEGVELQRALERARPLVPPEAGTDLVETLGRRVVLGGPERIAEVLNRYRGAGAGHAVLSLSVVPFGLLNRSFFERAAPALELVR